MSRPLPHLLPYTVVGYFRDNKQPFVEAASAGTPLDAAARAIESLLDINGWDADQAEEIIIVAILGHSPQADVVKAYDLPEVTPGTAFVPDAVACEDVLRSI